VDAPDTDDLLLASYGDGQTAVARQRLLVLRDLIALGQVGVEITLAGENAGASDIAIEGQGDAQGKLDGIAVDDGQYAGHSGADRADSTIGMAVGGIDHRAIAKHLRGRLEDGMHLKTDDGFIHRGHVCILMRKQQSGGKRRSERLEGKIFQPERLGNGRVCDTALMGVHAQGQGMILFDGIAQTVGSQLERIG
jgi:hypothetical protein